jgi:hypothetical protein
MSLMAFHLDLISILALFFQENINPAAAAASFAPLNSHKEIRQLSV